MLKYLSFVFLALATLLFICTNCSDDDSTEVGDPQQDSSQFSNEVLWISQVRQRRDSSELRGIMSPNSPSLHPQSNPSPGFRNYSPKYWTYQKVVPNSELFLALKKKRYMGIELPDFITKNDPDGSQGLDGGGQPRGLKQKLTHVG